MEIRTSADLRRALAGLGTAPLLVVLCDDGAELVSTLDHHIKAGMQHILLALAPGVAPPAPLPDGVLAWRLEDRPDDMVTACLNRVIPARPDGAWTGYVHNAEYLFHPFGETRRIGELLAFCAEERREALPSIVVDLYPGQHKPGGPGTDLTDSWLDRMGYFALDRERPDGPLERQRDLHGGLRWRFEEHVPNDRRRIDRVSFFRVRKGLTMRPDHTLSIEEMNTWECPWHRSPTAAVASFRAAKALATNPGSRAVIDGFRWDGSVRFDWRAQQLMDLGFMEPGQWF
ncbi:MAG: hypothetical protein AAF919_15745 [Pseudomonadota bacterium]